jgi:uncharacterized protein
MSSLPASRCQTCGHLSCPSVTYCPRGCGRTCAPDWVSSRGKVYSSTVIHIPHPELGAPYQVAYVDLDDGPRLFGRVASERSPVDIDQSVEADLTGDAAFIFKPLEPSA